MEATLNSRIDQTVARELPPRYAVLDETARVLRVIVNRIGNWLEMRERASADRDTLAQMSDRELADIGLDRARANAIADGMFMHDRGY